MIPVVGINSSSAPFMHDIGARLKLFETRSRRMLHPFLGQRVILAETRQGGYLAMYSAVIRSARPVYSRDEWEILRPLHRVPVDNDYDWNPGTHVKWLYEISDLRRLHPFQVPEGVRHGRTWMEYEPTNKRRYKV